MADNGKGSQIKTAAKISDLLNNNRRVSVKRIAAETGLTERSARRWVRAFADTRDLRVEAGVVILEE